jgi:hypothetical protein
MSIAGHGCYRGGFAEMVVANSMDRFLGRFSSAFGLGVSGRANRLWAAKWIKRLLKSENAAPQFGHIARTIVNGEAKAESSS